jgi:hypothetical protein
LKVRGFSRGNFSSFDLETKSMPMIDLFWLEFRVDPAPPTAVAEDYQGIGKRKRGHDWQERLFLWKRSINLPFVQRRQ